MLCVSAPFQLLKHVSAVYKNREKHMPLFRKFKFSTKFTEEKVNLAIVVRLSLLILTTRIDNS